MKLSRHSRVKAGFLSASGALLDMGTTRQPRRYAARLPREAQAIPNRFFHLDLLQMLLSQVKCHVAAG